MLGDIGRTVVKCENLNDDQRSTWINSRPEAGQMYIIESAGFEDEPPSGSPPMKRMRLVASNQADVRGEHVVSLSTTVDPGDTHVSFKNLASCPEP